MPPLKKRRSLLLSGLAGGLLIAAVGAGLVRFSLGDGLARLSYDLPFLWRSEVPDEVVMVYLDEKVKKNLGEPQDQPLDRSYHTRLVQNLKQDGAKLIFYDILFDEPSRDTHTDQEFAKAIEEQGAVVLVANYVKELQANAWMDAPLPPIEILKEKAAGCGLAKFTPDAADLTIRRIDTGAENYPSASWVAARLLKAPSTQNERDRLKERWLNYYGPPSRFYSVNLDHALAQNSLPPGFFQHKIVVVGSPPAVGLPGAQSDQFATPFSHFGRRLSSGAEVHALTLLNLLRGDWLERLGAPWELGLIVLWGFAAGFGLMLVRPWHAAWLAVSGALLIAATAIYLQLYRQIWWSWLVPAAVQTPLALVWSVGWQYALEFRRRKKLRQAFAAYLSPHLADRIANEEFDLALGGKVVDATVMFTDLAGFTALSENLDPAEVSAILTTYFNRTTRAILEEEGTIIKYMGDAVMALWGAPLPEANHAERAVTAAMGMIQAGRPEIAGRPLRTRIGINSGPVLAGNLGSDFRFDYTAIGDTTNLASRLESLNKYLDTDILVSDATRQKLSRAIQTRLLGRFLMAGKAQPVAVHEVLGTNAPPGSELPWIRVFDAALGHFRERNFEQAEKDFSEVIRLRGGHDGPSEFYLKEITSAAHNTRPGDAWDGVILLTRK